MSLAALGWKCSVHTDELHALVLLLGLLLFKPWDLDHTDYGVAHRRCGIGPVKEVRL